jgi:hypothetical protein
VGPPKRVELVAIIPTQGAVRQASHFFATLHIGEAGYVQVLQQEPQLRGNVLGLGLNRFA